MVYNKYEVWYLRNRPRNGRCTLIQPHRQDELFAHLDNQNELQQRRKKKLIILNGFCYV